MKAVLPERKGDWWHAFGLPPQQHEAHFADRVVRCFKDYPDDTYQLLEHSATVGPDRIALIYKGKRWSYRQLQQQVEQLASGLSARGIKAGDRVILFLGNRPEFIVAFFALQRLYAIPTPIGIREQRDGLTWMANQCQAAGIVYESRFADRIPQPGDAPALRTSLDVDTEDFKLLAGAAILPRAPAPGSAGNSAGKAMESTACILYTSGTTGRPKGAMLTHLNIAHSVMHYKYCLQLSEADCGVLVVPASHVTGLIALMLTMAYVGGRLLLVDEFKAASFLSEAAAEQVSYSVMVPAMYKLCLMQPDFLSHDLSSWRVGVYGGAPMPEDTIQKLAAHLPSMMPLNAYGATETTSPVTIMPLGLGQQHADSVGVVVPCGDVRVMDDEGRELKAGEPGELWISGPMVVAGYWDNPEATRKEFTGGYWHSGDIGVIDAAGFVKVQDRKKDMLNRGGFKIYSVEVENVLVGYPGVVEAAVLGRPCPVLGERVHAFIHLRENQSIDLDAVREYCARLLSDYKVPESFTISAAPLPRNANGKLLKRLMREQLPPLD